MLALATAVTLRRPPQGHCRTSTWFQLLPEEEAVLQERWIPHSMASGDEKEIPLGAYSAFVRVCKSRGDCFRRTLGNVAGVGTLAKK